MLAAEAEVGGHPLWQIRTHAEAEAAWKKEFGHLEAEGGAAAGEAAEPHHSGKTTLV